MESLFTVAPALRNYIENLTHYRTDEENRFTAFRDRGSAAITSGIMGFELSPGRVTGIKVDKVKRDPGFHRES